jgi:hypothetical protein
MSLSPSSPAAYFNRLLDEILLQILNHATEHESPFFLEYCVQFIKACMYLSIGKINSMLLSSQSVHFHDWRVACMTSRRIRGLGKKAFFGSKTIVVSYSLIKRLRNGTFLLFGSTSNQEFALRSIPSIIAAELSVPIASKLMRLPTMSRTFPKLEGSSLCFGLQKSGSCGFHL